MPKRDKMKKILAVLIALVVLALLGLLENIFVTDGVTKTNSRTSSGLVTVKDVTETELEDENAPIGVIKQYEFTLRNQISGDTSLAFYTVHQYVFVYIDGQEVYQLEPSEGKHITKTVGSNWVMIPLSIEDSGKSVKVEIVPVYEGFRNRQVEFLIGSPLAVYRDRLLKDLPQIILGGMTVFIGILFLCIAGYGKLKKIPENGLASLGLFSAMIGIWRLTDTRFTPFMDFGKPVFVYYISICMPMLGLLPLLHWAKTYFQKRYRRVLEIYQVAVMLLCLFQFSLQYFGNVDFRETMFLTHIAIGVGAFCLFAVVICEWKSETREVKKLPLELKLGLVCVAGVVLDVITFYIKGNSSGLLFTLLAFLVYIIWIGIFTMQKYTKQQMELARLDRQLTDSRIKAMMSQIRSHFIFNVLATISSYCKIDPQEADKALICFSRYLRRNIQNIEEDGLIDFSAELDQVEDYVKLEQLRFADRLTFITDMETTSFQIPPLTIQPIVENAIKHGIIEQGKKGMVTLQTRRRKSTIEIRVVDDGVGFEPQKLEDAKSVGIRNVRYRIENMMKGTINFESTPGKGTAVSIVIPMENK